MIYLASPYSGTPEQMEHRYRLALAYTATQLRLGVAIFSPIVYGHQLAKEVGTFAAAWKALNEAMILHSKELWVLEIEGWQESSGVQQEISLFQFLHQRSPKFVSLFE
jgi:hypothetical protein